MSKKNAKKETKIDSLFNSLFYITKLIKNNLFTKSCITKTNLFKIEKFFLTFFHLEVIKKNIFLILKGTLIII